MLWPTNTPMTTATSRQRGQVSWNAVHSSNDRDFESQNGCLVVSL